MNGKICIVTGSNIGIGKITAIELAKMGGHVVMICRDKSRGESAQAEIKKKSGNEKVDLLLADFSSQESIRRVAEEFNQKYDRLDVLVNNAGAIFGERKLTVDGIETTFAVNHLGYFLLTNLLLDKLKASAPSRIVNVASRAHMRTTMNFDDLYGEKDFQSFRAYAQSKLANVMFTYELAERLEGMGVTVNCLHPGVVATGFGRGGTKFFQFLFKLGAPLLTSPKKGAETSVFLASSPEMEDVSGKYFVNKRVQKSSDASCDREAWKRLWNLSEKLTGMA